MGGVSDLQAVLFDYSGTLFRLEEDESWFAGMELDTPLSPDANREIDGIFEFDTDNLSVLFS